LTVLFIGIGLTVVVGQILVRSGRPFLEDVFPHRETASSVTQLLVVLFHLIVLGIIALVASIPVNLEHQPIQTIVVRIGLILLVLGVAYGSTLLLLARLRARRREQLLTDEHNAQVERAQQVQAQQHGQPGGAYPPAAQTYPPAAPQIYPVSEPPGPGR
ncbi:MAG TPA: hypothetical protein VFQ48_02970, partial [Pseudonocardiaceae bacterium]|nr:hypothetical protein [Pseudonocardiaceae bacterium]